MKIFLVTFSLIFSFVLPTMAKKDARKPSSAIGCDKALVSQYISEKMERFQAMLKEGQLTSDDVQSLIGAVSATVEMNALSCGWVKIEEKKELDFCTQTKITQTRWNALESQGAISAEDKKFLVGAQKVLAEMKKVTCK